MGDKIKLVVWGIIAAASLFLVNGVSIANSFPFRAVEPGEALPPIQLAAYQGKETLTTAQLRGKPTVLVFWGADIPTKKERSIKILKKVGELVPFLSEKGITVLAINAQNDSGADIDEVLAALNGSIPVYTDPSGNIYGDLGIYVMPALLLIDREGKVAAGMGYSHDLEERLRGEVEIMLGEKTREQVEAELRPEVIEKSAEEKAATRHQNLGMVMLERGMPDNAIREFEEAVRLEPDEGKSYAQLGCLYLEMGQMEKAEEALAKAVDLKPDYLPGLICDAQRKAKQGAVDEAVADLQSLMLRNSRNAHLRYVLGTFLEQQGSLEQAAKEYRKAYELLDKKMQHE